MLAFSPYFPLFFPALIVAITVHEAMHAYAAVKLGDDTPLREGRVTLNPLRHLTWIGTLMILFAPIGWGRPVNYNPLRFRDYKWGTVITAAAGPFSNFVLAFAAAIPLRHMSDFLAENFYLGVFLNIFFQINISLLVFNLIPIPPLDGSKILLAVVPAAYRWRYEQWLHEGGLKYFLGLFLLDWFIARYSGFSIFLSLLEFLAWPLVSLIYLGIGGEF